MAISQFDKQNFTEDEIKQAQFLTEEYDRQMAAGNVTGAQSVHDALDKIRSGYGYTGGTSGTGYVPFQNESSRSTPSSSDSMIQEIIRQRTDALKSDLSSAYEQNVNALNREKASLPIAFTAARNQTAGQSETQRANFNEYAAASGLNSGTGGQAQLAFSNQLQGNLNTLNTAEAEAVANVDLQLANLRTQYQNDVNRLMAQGAFEEAEAMYNEFQTLRAQALDEARYNQQLKIDTERYNQQMAMTTDDAAYQRALQEYTATGNISVMAPWWTTKAAAPASTPDYTPDYTPPGTPQINQQSVLNLGMGPMSYETLERLVEDGTVVATKDANGVISFAKVTIPQAGALDLMRPYKVGGLL